jgi:hypothetical protein
MSERATPYGNKDINRLLTEHRNLVESWKAGDRSEELVRRFRDISLELISNGYSEDVVDVMCEILKFDRR